VLLEGWPLLTFRLLGVTGIWTEKAGRDYRDRGKSSSFHSVRDLVISPARAS
jgi:hypothetical protein